MKRKCTCCGKQFRLTTNPDQTFCSEAACQRERKLRWQRKKLRTDPDYPENKRNAQKKWASKNSGYWRQYRQDRKAGGRQSRLEKPPPPTNSIESNTVKSDALTPQIPLQTGLYWIQAITPPTPAKSDAFMVEMRFVSSTCASAKNDGIDAESPAAYLPVPTPSPPSAPTNGCAPDRR